MEFVHHGWVCSAAPFENGYPKIEGPWNEAGMGGPVTYQELTLFWASGRRGDLRAQGFAWATKVEDARELLQSLGMDPIRVHTNYAASLMRASEGSIEELLRKYKAVVRMISDTQQVGVGAASLSDYRTRSDFPLHLVWLKRE
jgi:hypothetical protein